jgi:hypothetical protein
VNDERAADAIFDSGRVWTGAAQATPVEAVAVRDGRIVAVGTRADVGTLVGTRTRHVPIGDGLLLPAFADSHCHPLAGGLAQMACDLSGGTTLEAWLTTVATYARQHPSLAVIWGEGWTPYGFPGGLPHKRQLDAIVADRPVVLERFDGHTTWANSAALQAAGIDADTPDPPRGHIVRDGHGEAIGVFDEEARALVGRLVPTLDAAQQVDGLRRGQAYLHGLGIGSWLDAIVEPDSEAAYLALVERGELTGRAALALCWDPARGLEQLRDLVQRRDAIEAHSDGNLQATAVKLFADGVVESSTASLLRPYSDGSATDLEGLGAGMLEAAQLREICIAADAAGFDVHTHAIGDRAVRGVLDALDAARTVNGPRDARHAIAHLELVDDADIPRFGRLGVIAACQPLWAVHDETDGLLVERLGPERLERRYPFGRLHRAGAPLALGSDWNVSTADPLAIMLVAVSRTVPGTVEGRPLGPSGERLDLGIALSAYTHGSARIVRSEREAGSIEVGKAADLVMLEGDPLRAGVGLPECRVLMTMVQGRVVFEA